MHGGGWMVVFGGSWKLWFLEKAVVVAGNRGITRGSVVLKYKRTISKRRAQQSMPAGGGVVVWKMKEGKRLGKKDH